MLGKSLRDIADMFDAQRRWREQPQYVKRVELENQRLTTRLLGIPDEMSDEEYQKLMGYTREEQKSILDKYR